MACDQVIIIGDPILDRYIKASRNGERLMIHEVLNIDGGAANVYRNLSVILGTAKTKVVPAWDAPLSKDGLPVGTPVLTRIVENYIDKPTVTSEFWDRKDSDMQDAISQYFWYPYWSHVNLENSGLVVSDYNKGAVNRPLPYGMPNLTKTKFTIVDSKHRTLEQSIAMKSNCKILHATGTELNKVFAAAHKFDYIIWTNGPQPVELMERQDDKYVSISSFYVPVSDQTQSSSLYTVGAGDTFVAAAAAFLSQVDEIDKHVIESAIVFAIKCCQTVVTEPYTSVSKLTL
jgi:bifunctional ADP-heptose synthase (sugar kinase/adenylyltransferase)